MANYVFFVSANPPRTDTNCIDVYWYRNISPKSLLCYLDCHEKFWSLGKFVRRTHCFIEHWSFAENLCPRADQFSMKKLVSGQIFHEKLVHCIAVGPRFQLQFSLNFDRGIKIPWKIGPKLKILLKTRANSAKLSAFSDSVTPIYPKNDLKFRAF